MWNIILSGLHVYTCVLCPVLVICFPCRIVVIEIVQDNFSLGNDKRVCVRFTAHYTEVLYFSLDRYTNVLC